MRLLLHGYNYYCYLLIAKSNISTLGVSDKMEKASLSFYVEVVIFTLFNHGLKV